MPRRFALWLALSGLLCLLLLGCSKPKPPTITPRKAKVTSVTPTGLGLELTYEAYNPNGFELSVNSVTATATLNGTLKLPPATVQDRVTLPAKQRTLVNSKVTIPWTHLQQVLGMAANRPKIPYRVVGRANVGGESLNVDVPFTIDGEVTQAQLLGAGINSLKGIPGLLPK